MRWQTRYGLLAWLSVSRNEDNSKRRFCFLVLLKLHSYCGVHLNWVYYRHHALSQVERTAAGLADRGLQKNDVFAVYLPNVIEYPVIFNGVNLAGGIVTPGQ